MGENNNSTSSLFKLASQETIMRKVEIVSVYNPHHSRTFETHQIYRLGGTNIYEEGIILIHFL